MATSSLTRSTKNSARRVRSVSTSKTNKSNDKKASKTIKQVNRIVEAATTVINVGLQRDTLQRFVDLKARRKALEAELEEVMQETAAVKEVLLEQFAEVGTSNIKFNGQTIYTDKKLWARPKEGLDKRDVCKILSSIGLGEFVAEDYNSNKLSGWIREKEKEARQQWREEYKDTKGEIPPFNLADYLPEQLASVVEINPTYDVKLRGKAS